ncbi:hemerythrin HHE cation binding domain-containing protein [Stagonosporopsis vannaccii]|nr:hemerythrin HHE cation binding domain-containing protein [Stagonosporopsis vannaccii]
MATTTILSPTTVFEEQSLTKVLTTVTTTSVTAAPASSSPLTFSWQRGPIPLISTPLSQNPSIIDQYTHAASEMALVHNCIIRALNSIYNQSPHIPASEHTNFLSFCQATYRGLVAHHDGEEEYFFPDLERITGEKGVMAENIQGHKDFEEGFGAWGQWVAECLSNSSSSGSTTSFSSERNLELMDAFLAPLSAHLHDEIPSLLALRRFGDALDLAKMFKDEGEKVMGGMCKTTVLPVFLLNHDEGFEGGVHSFPPLPGVVKWVLKNGFGRVKGAWWKFAACGYDGAAREVRFGGSKD